MQRLAEFLHLLNIKKRSHEELEPLIKLSVTESLTPEEDLFASGAWLYAASEQDPFTKATCGADDDGGRPCSATVTQLENRTLRNASKRCSRLQK